MFQVISLLISVKLDWQTRLIYLVSFVFIIFVFFFDSYVLTQSCCIWAKHTDRENSNYKSFQQTSVVFSFWKSMQDLKVFLPNKVCLSV